MVRKKAVKAIMDHARLCDPRLNSKTSAHRQGTNSVQYVHAELSRLMMMILACTWRAMVVYGEWSRLERPHLQ